MSAGIDYGMGKTNRDAANGIRFGVISCNSVSCEALSDVEYDYGDPCCPKCGNVVVEYSAVDDSMLAQGAPPSADWEQYERGCADFACERCEHTLDSSEVYGDEATGWHYEGDGYQLASCLDNDVMVLKSRYFTKARFCSPCVPGAGNLDSFDSDGVETYCLGHDWFESREAPYPVFSVETGKEVLPNE
jgi:hypothetical protein